MTIQYYSDLHLEFDANNYYMSLNPIPAIGEILILAGDISYWNKNSFKNPFFDHVSKAFSKVYYIPGNHEYYLNKNVQASATSFKIPIRENVFLVNNMSIEIDDVEFFFTTLWSKIPETKAMIIQEQLNDYRRIKYNDHLMTFNDSNYLHELSVNWLQTALARSNKLKTVVATHHVPSRLCNPKKFYNSYINDAFVSEQASLMLDYDIDYWIYGHHHHNMETKQIGNTQLVTNQLGYRSYEKIKLKDQPIIEI